MNEETARIIIEILKQLGVEISDKVNAMVEISWPVIVRQVYMETIGYGFVFIALVAISAVAFYYFRKQGKNKKKYLESGGRVYTSQYQEYDEIETFTLVVSMVFAVGSLFPLHSIIVRLINPLWYAAELIKEVIK